MRTCCTMFMKSLGSSVHGFAGCPAPTGSWTLLGLWKSENEIVESKCLGLESDGAWTKLVSSVVALMAGSETGGMKGFKLTGGIGYISLVSPEKRFSISYGGVSGVEMAGNGFTVTRI